MFWILQCFYTFLNTFSFLTTIHILYTYKSPWSDCVYCVCATCTKADWILADNLHHHLQRSFNRWSGSVSIDNCVHTVYSVRERGAGGLMGWGVEGWGITTEEVVRRTENSSSFSGWQVDWAGNDCGKLRAAVLKFFLLEQRKHRSVFAEHRWGYYNHTNEGNEDI